MFGRREVVKATGHWKRENDGSRAADKLFIAPAGLDPLYTAYHCIRGKSDGRGGMEWRDSGMEGKTEILDFYERHETDICAVE
jgi:hypothetical protein